MDVRSNSGSTRWTSSSRGSPRRLAVPAGARTLMTRVAGVLADSAAPLPDLLRHTLGLGRILRKLLVTYSNRLWRPGPPWRPSLNAGASC